MIHVPKVATIRRVVDTSDLLGGKQNQQNWGGPAMVQGGAP
jgi:hypothetical protein